MAPVDWVADPWLGFAGEAAFVMARILFITSAHPGGSGFIGAGEGICEFSLRALVANGYEVHVLCFASLRQQPNPGVVALCASYRTLAQSGMQSLFGILRGWRWGSLLAPWFFTRCSPSNLRAVSKLHLPTPSSRMSGFEFPSIGICPILWRSLRQLFQARRGFAEGEPAAITRFPCWAR